MKGLNEICLTITKILKMSLSTKLTWYFRRLFLLLSLEKCMGWKPPRSILNLISAKTMQLVLWMRQLMRNAVFIIFYAPHVKDFFSSFYRVQVLESHINYFVEHVPAAFFYINYSNLRNLENYSLHVNSLTFYRSVLGSSSSVLWESSRWPE